MAYTRVVLRDLEIPIIRDHINRENKKIKDETDNLNDTKVNLSNLNSLIDTKLGTTGVGVSILPTVTNTVNLGSTTKRFEDVYVNSEINLGSNILSHSGNTLTVSDNLNVGGNLTVTGTTTFNGGTITMGDSDTDNVVFGADINSNIIPNTTNTFTLGTSDKKFSNVHSTTFTGNVIGNVTGNLTGNVTGSSVTTDLVTIQGLNVKSFAIAMAVAVGS
jgi:hypothetical protein